MRAWLVWAAVGSAAFVFTPRATFAQEEEATSVEDIEKSLDEEEEQKDGWTLTLKLGGNFNLNDSQNVIGSDDGLTIQFGLLLGANARFKKGQHRWNNELVIQHNQTLTPQIDRFVKSFDLFDLRTMYIYKLKSVEWLGPYVRFAMQTPLLPGYAVRAEETEVIRFDEDGETELERETIGSGDEISLTGAFEPLQLRESAGLFGDPIDEQEIRLAFQIGFAVQQIIARDGSIISNEDGNVIETTRIESLNDLGAEAELALRGEIVKDVLNYRFVSNVFWAAVTSSDREELQEFENQINLRILAGIGVAITEWMNLEYSLNVIRQPQVLNEFQVQNGLQLLFEYNVL